MPGVSHTAYSAAKFAVKGFTEALVTDLRNYAPHVRASIVMPGGVGTPIGRNSRRVLAGGAMSEVGRRKLRQTLRATGVEDADPMDDAALEAAEAMLIRRFEEMAPTTAAQAATIILDGVKADRWRILVGEDVTRLDRRVRAEPDRAYDPDFAAYAPD